MKSISGRTYYTYDKLGEGTYSNVYAARCKNKEYAFKRYNLDILEELPQLHEGCLKEISLLGILSENNCNIIKLVDIIDLDKKIGIILPKYEHTLYKFIVGRLIDISFDKAETWEDGDDSDKENKTPTTIPERRKKEKSIKKIMYQVLVALACCHKNGIIHRDIKPDNILLDSDYNAILADFTLAKEFTGLCKEGTHSENITTLPYRPPEVYNNTGYNMTIDCWSAGLMFYELITSKFIPVKKDPQYVYTTISKRKSTGDKMLDKMLDKLLIFNPVLRCTPSQALSCGYFDEKVPEINIYKKCITTNFFIIDDIQSICDYLGVKLKITRIAAQVYYTTTSDTIENSVLLAIKMYEYYEYNPLLCTQLFIDFERKTLQNMDYNLLI